MHGSPTVSQEAMSKEHGREKRSLLNLCVGVLGRHLEDITDHLHCVAQFLPPSIKMTLLAIARRKDLITDKVLEALVDESWEVLDISGGRVTDFGLEKASEKCALLKAVDISECDNLTSLSFEALVKNCPLMQTLRCGGTTSSNATAKQSMHLIAPRLDSEAEAEESWETLESKRVGSGASNLRWLVWPAIDLHSHKEFLMKCPKVVVNPTTSSLALKLHDVRHTAYPDEALDSPAVIGIDSNTWAVNECSRKNFSLSSTKTNILQPNSPSLEKNSCQLSIAERFKLAFEERDERLASKRAKNSRQKQRRADKAWLGSDSDAKAVFWASIAQRAMKK